MSVAVWERSLRGAGWWLPPPASRGTAQPRCPLRGEGGTIPVLNASRIQAFSHHTHILGGKWGFPARPPLPVPTAGARGCSVPVVRSDRGAFGGPQRARGGLSVSPAEFPNPNIQPNSSSPQGFLLCLPWTSNIKSFPSARIISCSCSVRQGTRCKRCELASCYSCLFMCG